MKIVSISSVGETKSLIPELENDFLTDKNDLIRKGEKQKSKFFLNLGKISPSKHALTAIGRPGKAHF